jgi:hypothetical protein
VSLEVLRLAFVAAAPREVGGQQGKDCGLGCEPLDAYPTPQSFTGMACHATSECYQ